MEVTETSITLRAQPGRYYIGDPCFAIDPAHWHQFLKSKDTVFRATLMNHTCIVFPTGTGDGAFRDSNGYIYDVDSGSIALVPEEIATGATAHTSGRFLYFGSPFDCRRRTERGRATLQFGALTIDAS